MSETETPAPPARRGRPPRQTVVLRTERLTPGMIRIVVGGDDLHGFGAGAYTDHYVKLQIPPAGAPYEAPFDVEDIRARLPKEQWPRTRSYTVAAWDPERTELTLDFVYHGDHGVAGPWAAAAKPGDRLQLAGPGGGYTPDPDAAWHLMVGDASCIPAIAASLQRVPEGVPVVVLVQVHGAEDEQELTTPGDLRVTWLHEPGDDVLADAVAALAFPEGPVHAFVHGEASSVRAVRRVLLAERGVAREALSVSGYWKSQRTDEDWRAEKAEWNRLVEEDLTAQR